MSSTPEDNVLLNWHSLLILTAVVSILDATYRQQPEPYYTSILTGQAWVIELLTGHPEHIQCELGVHRHVFIALISELHEMGLRNSRSVSLEEKLSIFIVVSLA